MEHPVIEVTRSLVHVIETEKAGIERSRALLIPSPPLETGIEAWAQAVSSMETFVMASRPLLTRSKPTSKLGTFQIQHVKLNLKLQTCCS